MSKMPPQRISSLHYGLYLVYINHLLLYFDAKLTILGYKTADERQKMFSVKRFLVSIKDYRPPFVKSIEHRHRP